MSEVLVLAETTPAGVRKPTLELLTAAARLGEPSAVLFGSADDGVVAALGEYGAEKVYVVADAAIDDYLSQPKAEALVQIAKSTSPAAILVTSGPEGKDIAARVAVRLESAILTDAVDVTSEGGTIQVTQSVVSGQFLATSQAIKGTPVVTIRPNSINAEPKAGAAAVEHVELTLDDKAKGTKVNSRSPKVSTGRPDLTEAAQVISGGLGVGNQDGFAVIEALADAMGAAVGATRAVTDQEWVAHDLQIGQTGKTVAPALYLAAGVSGAIQHRAGMQSSKAIVVVNKDPKAPLFKIADYGVVGDLHKVLPALTEEVKRRKA